MNHPPSQSGARFAAFALRHAVPMNLLFVFLVLVGAIVVNQMPVDVYPDVSLDEATINTFWLGASAQDVERLITDRIEDKIQDIRGVDRLLSDSKPDLSRIRVKFRESLSDIELDAAFRQLRAAVEQVVDLPEDADKPVVTKISVAEVFFLLWVVVEDVNGVGEQALHNAAYRLKPVLRDIPGVAKVDDTLIRDREIHVLANRDALRKYGLTLPDLSELLLQYNRNLPSGTVPDGEGEWAVRAAGGVTDPAELGSIVVLKNPRGGHVRLRDLATIVPGFERKTVFPRYNLNNALAFGIAKTDEADSRVVATEVRQALAGFESRLPPGVALRVVDDASDIIQSRLQVLGTNLGWGIALVFVVLWAVVGLRNSILAIVGIPFSFFCALIFMHVLGVTINAVSLIGLVLCSGMIVDDAIVVLESIYRHIENISKVKGGKVDRHELRRAIIDGTGEVIWPVISSSATTVAAFLPLLIMTGVTGEFFSIIPKTVTVVLLASLFECLLILPVHYLDWGARKKRGAEQRVLDSGNKPVLPSQQPHLAFPTGECIDPLSAPSGLAARIYDRALTMMLRHRYVSLLPLLSLGFLALSVAPLIDVTLFPSEFQQCLVDVRTADEASLDQTADLVKPIERIALELGPERVPAVMTWFGLLITEDNDVELRNNVAQLHVQLASSSAVGADSTVVANELRNRIEDYIEDHPHRGIKSFHVWAPRSGPPIGKPVSVRIECADFATAKALAEDCQAHLRSIEGVHAVSDNLNFGQKQINLRVLEDRASLHGLTFLSLAAVLRTANDGHVVSTFKDQRSGEDLDVRLMLDSRYRSDLEDLLDLDVRGAGGYVLQVGQVAELDMNQSYAGIPHYNGRRVVTVTAEVDTAVTTAKAVNESVQRALAPKLVTMPGVRVVYGGEYAETVATFASLKKAYVIALAVIYLLLATQFRSYAQPLVIIVTVPFACVGVVAGLLIGGYPFTIMTFIAIVGMSGVVVNDSILLVDCINQQIAQGRSLLDALRFATLRRARPVLLTTITTVVGLAPLALGLGGYSKIWSPFASSFACGLAFATVITMFFVPTAYHIASDVAHLLRRESASERRRDRKAAYNTVTNETTPPT